MKNIVIVFDVKSQIHYKNADISFLHNISIKVKMFDELFSIGVALKSQS